MKIRQMRHGKTLEFKQEPKSSKLYIKRDLNKDAFCKINSHMGDMDNDPHTPKSTGSLSNSRKKKIKKAETEVTCKHKEFFGHPISAGTKPIGRLIDFKDVTTPQSNIHNSEDDLEEGRMNHQIFFEGCDEMKETEEKITARDLNFQRVKLNSQQL